MISLGDQVLGFLGQVHPVTAKAYDIPETYVAELNLSAIEAALQPAAPFVEITKFPAVSRDIALLSRQKSLTRSCRCYPICRRETLDRYQTL